MEFVCFKLIENFVFTAPKVHYILAQQHGGKFSSYCPNSSGRTAGIIINIWKSIASIQGGKVVFGCCWCFQWPQSISESCFVTGSGPECIYQCFSIWSLFFFFFCPEPYNEYQKSWESLKRMADKEWKEWKLSSQWNRCYCTSSNCVSFLVIRVFAILDSNMTIVTNIQVCQEKKTFSLLS